MSSFDGCRRFFLTWTFATLGGGTVGAETVPVLQKEGVVHGFLVLRSTDGTALADGDLVQVHRSDELESKLVFRFRDGSLHEETVVFTQEKVFELASYRLIQKGPSFPDPIEVELDRGGVYRVRHQSDGEEELLEGRIELPPDVYNGMFFTLLKNLPPDTGETEVQMLAFTPEPKMVTVVVSPSEEDTFSLGDSSRKAVHYVLDVEVEGLEGILADLLGKEPPPLHVWISRGEAPTFVRFRGYLYPEGPSWWIELAAPKWLNAADSPPASPP